MNRWVDVNFKLKCFLFILQMKINGRSSLWTNILLNSSTWKNMEQQLKRKKQQKRMYVEHTLFKRIDLVISKIYSCYFNCLQAIITKIYKKHTTASGKNMLKKLETLQTSSTSSLCVSYILYFFYNHLRTARNGAPSHLEVHDNIFPLILFTILFLSWVEFMSNKVLWKNTFKNTKHKTKK